MDSVVTLRLIRRQELERRTGFARSTIYAAIKPGGCRYDPSFPQPIKIGNGTVAWLESEVNAWIMQRIADRDGRASPVD